MRKILLVALICLLGASLIGCDNMFGSDEGISIGDPAPEERSGYEGAQMKYISSTNTSLTVFMENTTDSTWQSGNMRDYHLEVERDGVWYEVEDKAEIPNTMELMLFAPGNTLTHTFDFSERYGKLDSGKYRVVKAWWANATESTPAGEFYLMCEFTVA